MLYLPVLIMEIILPDGTQERIPIEKGYTFQLFR